MNKTSNNRKQGDLEFCSSDGTCFIHLDFIPDVMTISPDGHYKAVSFSGKEHEGVVPFGPYSGQKVNP